MVKSNVENFQIRDGEKRKHFQLSEDCVCVTGLSNLSQHLTYLMTIESQIYDVSKSNLSQSFITDVMI